MTLLDLPHHLAMKGSLINSEPRDTASDGRHIGTMIHQVIAALSGGGDWSPHAILEVVGKHPGLERFGGYRAAARHRLATSAAVYGRFLRPRDAELEDFELKVPDGRLDLVWHRPGSGERWADELKTGTFRQFASEGDLREQLSRQSKGGAATLDNFLGVRACFVGSPAQSMLWTPAGDVRTLDEGLQVRAEVAA